MEEDDADPEDEEDRDAWGLGGGAGGLGSTRLSERVTRVTPTVGLDTAISFLQIRLSAVGYCLVSAQAEHPANLPLLSMAQDGTGRGGEAGEEGGEKGAALEPPGLQILGSNSGVMISPLLIGFWASFLQLFVTLVQ